MAVLVPLSLVALWLTLEHRPGWYRPAVLDPADIQRARREATNRVDSIGDRLVAHEPFELVLTDREANEWLTALPDIWPEAIRSMPPEITEPAVRFADGGILIGGHFAKNGWRVILSARLVADFRDVGSVLELRLTGVYGGSLPFPRALLGRFVDPLLRRASGGGGNIPPEPPTMIHSLREVRSTKQLYEGIQMPNRFIWPNGRRPFRIDGFTIREGELRVRIHPL